MTSASELFYNRRSRTARNSDLELISTSDREDHHHHHHHHHHHRYQEDCDLFRRSRIHPQTRHLCHRVPQTRELLRLENGTSRSLSANSNRIETLSSRSDRSRFTRNDRLPGAVLQARARLLERLRGISLTRSRQGSAASSTSVSEFYPAITEEFRFVDSGDWETEIQREWLVTGDLHAEQRFQTELSLLELNNRKTKPPGLSQEAIDKLRREVFVAVEGQVEGVVLEPLEECCICLERFLEGDALICLPCGHRFHPVCLDPWVSICGDCPYCRMTIQVDFGE